MAPAPAWYSGSMRNLQDIEGIPLRPDPGFGAVFLCPVCGDSHCHMGEITRAASGDVWISIEGESCGHKWQLRLMNHKGQLQGKIILP